MFSDFDELVGVATEAAPGSDGHCLWCDLPLAPGEVRVLRSFKPATSTWTGQQRWLALQPTAAERGSADEEGDADGDGERVVIVEGYHPQCAFQYAGAVHATCRACGRESRGFGGDRVVTRMANRVSSIAAPAVAPAAAAAAATAGGGEADDGGGHARCSEARLRSSGALSGRLYHCFACVARFVGEHRALLRGQLSPAQAQCDVAWRPRYWRNAFHRGEGKSECGKVLLPGGDTRADFLRCFDDSVGDVGGDTRGVGAHGAGGGGSGSACTARQEPPPVAGAASAASAEEGGGRRRHLRWLCTRSCRRRLLPRCGRTPGLWSTSGRSFPRARQRRSSGWARCCLWTRTQPTSRSQSAASTIRRASCGRSA